MKDFQKARAWFSSPKSDFYLFLIVLVLANLVGARAFFRVDLTSRHSYSLSQASKEVIKSIEEPLGVKVFFSGNLPAPYNSVERYLKDLLLEYKGVGNRRFSYDFFDMEKAENKELAESYGIVPVQVQEVKNDEVGVKNAYMGLAIIYSDAIEPINDISTSDGLEYRLTTTIGKVVTTANSLAGLSGKIGVTLYASSNLEIFKIQGYSDLDKTVRAAFDQVNRKTNDKLEYHVVDNVSPSELDALVARYGLQKISWGKQSNGIEAGVGVLGIALEYQDKVRTIPISLVRGLFGGYGLSGLNDLDQSLTESLQGLLSNTLTVGYTTGHGEKSLSDDREGAAHFQSIVSDLYAFKELDLSKDDIPANLTTIVINGPREKYGDVELYKIDQFLMRGGNLLVMLDPFNEIAPQGNGMFGGQLAYIPLTTGLEGLMEKYGAKLEKNYVLDSDCYIARQQGSGEVPLYYVPIIGKKGMNRDSVVSRNLANVLFLKAGEVTSTLSDTDGKDKGERRATPLVTTSDESWLMSGQINLMPYAMAKPEKDKLGKHDLAILVEGRFESAFEKAPENADTEGKDSGIAEKLTSETHLAKSVQSGKIILVGTSEIAGPSLIDAEGKQPVAIFTRNALDYLCGNQDLNDMRTKGLTLNPLDKIAPSMRTLAKSLNMEGLPLIVVIAGLIAWRRRSKRRERIQAFYAQIESKKVEG